MNYSTRQFKKLVYTVFINHILNIIGFYYSLLVIKGKRGQKLGVGSAGCYKIQTISIYSHIISQQNAEKGGNKQNATGIFFKLLKV